MYGGFAAFEIDCGTNVETIISFGLFLIFPVVWRYIHLGNKRRDLSGHSQNTSTYMWYDNSASKWDEALPVGNGRLGAMVFASADQERIQLNEETYWSGGPYSTLVAGGASFLPEIQRLVFAESYLEAHNLFGRHLMGYPVEQQKYQSLANIHLFCPHVNVRNYCRSLNLESGIASTSYFFNDIQFTREIFASSPDQVIAIRLSADRLGSISFMVNLRGVRNQTHSNYGTDYFRMDLIGSDELVLRGKSADYLGVPGRIKYEVRLKVIAEGGIISTQGVNLTVTNANVATLYVVAATNFVNYKDVSADEHDRVESYLQALVGKSFESIRQSAIDDHAKYFSRVSLSLPVCVNSSLPTDERKVRFQAGEADPSLAALAYNFGRYILIASSRLGTQPTNLQGIWNDDMNPSWDSKYTTNINMEMNYWAVDSANLSELAQPLFRFISELTDQGAQVAKEHYGAGGWVFHQNTDIWRVAAPMDGPTWGTFTVGGAWLCTHLWEHYQYTHDLSFLAETAYPLMEGSVQFFVDFLVEHPNGRWLVTNPSTSPENFPDGGGNGPYFDEVTGAMLPGTTICAGSSIDMQILFDLFGYYLSASEILDKKSSLVEEARAARARLVPPQIGRDGSLQEWADDWASLEKNHRHFSHLYGLYPGNVLWEKRNPELLEAYKKVLNERGDGGKGFSTAWKMALWARLRDGDRAMRIFRNYLEEQSCMQLFAKCGRTLQVDGALGVTAAVTEMLVQSQDGYIELLPALPTEWPSGEFRGVCTRGAFELHFRWLGRQLTYLQVFSRVGATLRIKAVGLTSSWTVVAGGGGSEVSDRLAMASLSLVGGSLLELQTVAHATYTLSET